MSKEHTDQALREEVVSYLRHRGAITRQELLQCFPSQYYILGKEQDIIGWDGFVMGMVSGEFQRIQADHLAINSSRLKISGWVHRFTTHLLQITHCQWIYRNAVVHDAIDGEEAQSKKQLLQEKIDIELGQGA